MLSPKQNIILNIFGNIYPIFFKDNLIPYIYYTYYIDRKIYKILYFTKNMADWEVCLSSSSSPHNKQVISVQGKKISGHVWWPNSNGTTKGASSSNGVPKWTPNMAKTELIKYLHEYKEKTITDSR